MPTRSNLVTFAKATVDYQQLWSLNSFDATEGMELLRWGAFVLLVHMVRYTLWTNLEPDEIWILNILNQWIIMQIDVL